MIMMVMLVPNEICYHVAWIALNPRVQSHKLNPFGINAQLHGDFPKKLPRRAPQTNEKENNVKNSDPSGKTKNITQ